MKKINAFRLSLVLLAVLLMCSALVGCETDIKTPGASATATPESSFLPFTEGVTSYKDYVKLGEYKKISIVKDIKVTEDDIFAEYVKMLDEQKFTGVTNRAVKKGDAISLAYCGYLDGVKFAGGEDDDSTLIVGSGTMIPGFEDACIGVMPGKDFDINVTFPKDYGQKDLAGKAVVFKSKVNYIFPEMSDSTASIATEGEYKTAADLHKFIKDGITEARESEWENNMVSKVVEKVYKNTEILKYPEGAIEVAIEGYENRFESQGINDPASYYGMSKEEYKEYITKQAEYDMGTRLMRYRIAEIENITVTDEDVDKFAADSYSKYGYESAEQFIEYNTRAFIKETLLLDKVDAYLVGNVTAVDSSESK